MWMPGFLLPWSAATWRAWQQRPCGSKLWLRRWRRLRRLLILPPHRVVAVQQAIRRHLLPPMLHFTPQFAQIKGGA